MQLGAARILAWASCSSNYTGNARHSHRRRTQCFTLSSQIRSLATVKERCAVLISKDWRRNLKGLTILWKIPSRLVHSTGLYCNTIQSIGLYCNTVHSTGLYCNTVLSTGLYCNTVHSTGLYCNTVHFTGLYCNTIHSTAPYCSKSTLLGCTEIQSTNNQLKLLQNMLVTEAYLCFPLKINYELFKGTVPWR